MAPPHAYKRRQYLVDRSYQVRFVSRVFVLILTIAALSLVLSSSLLWVNMYQPGLPPQPPLIAALLAVGVMLVFELLIAIPLVFILSVRQSHRIVGPMRRIKRALKAIGAGDFSQHLALRRGDALEDLAQAINETATSLQKRIPPTPSG